MNIKYISGSILASLMLAPAIQAVESGGDALETIAVTAKRSSTPAPMPTVISGKYAGQDQADSVEAAKRLALENLDKLEKFLAIDTDGFSLKPVGLDGNDGDLTLGVAYSLDYRYYHSGDVFKGLNDDNSINYDIAKKSLLTGMEIKLTSSGQFALDAEDNTENFTKTDLTFGWRIRYRDKSNSAAFASAFGGFAACVPALLEQGISQDDAVTQCEGTTQVSDAYEARKGFVADVVFNADVGVETQQDLGDAQWRYGGRLDVDLYDTRTHSLLGWLNAPDYIASLARELTGVSNYGAIPQGRYFPSVEAGISQVSPSGGSQRALLGDSSDFARFDLDVSYRAPFALVSKDLLEALIKSQNPEASNDLLSSSEDKVLLFLSARFRYFRELNPAQLIRDAGLHSQTRWEVSLGGNQGFYISYARGELPLDLEDDEVFQVGWKINWGGPQ